MKPSKAIIAGAAVTGSMAARAYAANASSHAGVALQTVADAQKKRYQNIPAKVKAAARARAVASSGWELLQRRRTLRNRWKQDKVVIKSLPSKLAGASGKGRLRYFSDSLVLVRPVKNGLTDASLCT